VAPAGTGTANLLGITTSDNFARGNKFFELSNHLGNVLVTVSDRKFGQSTVNNLYTSFTADVVSATDYAPFGMQMVGRSFDAAGSTAYRYGFNGQEKTPEVSNNSFTAEYWQYDARIGRRWNVDPVTIPWESVYLVNSNNPVSFLDPNGDFRNWFSAFVFKVTHGGGRISKAKSGNHTGEWRVFQEMKDEELEDERRENPLSVIVGSKVFYNWKIEPVAKVESNFDIGVQLEVRRKFGKLGGGFQVFELGKIEAGYENGEWKAQIKNPDQRVHNYVIAEIELGRLGTEKIGTGFKYDYNYAYYNSYSGPKKDGIASHDFGSYFFNSSRGKTDWDKHFSPLSNPLTYKTKLGGNSKVNKPFFGIEYGGSLKVIFGIDYKAKIGFYY
jgi:RHS repeat-associated protein